MFVEMPILFYALSEAAGWRGKNAIIGISLYSSSMEPSNSSQADFTPQDALHQTEACVVWHGLGETDAHKKATSGP